MTDALLAAYSLSLAELTDEELSVGFIAVLRKSGDYIPKPGDILEAAIGPPLDHADGAELAWVALDLALTAGNTRPLPERTKRVCHQMGGGSYLMKLPRKEFAFRRRQFLTLWQAEPKAAAAIEYRGQGDCVSHQQSLADQADLSLKLKVVE